MLLDLIEEYARHLGYADLIREPVDGLVGEDPAVRPKGSSYAAAVPAPPGEVVLTTDRLVLRRFAAADVDLLVELDSDPQVMRRINGGRPTPRSEIENEVLPAFLLHYETWPGYGFFAAHQRSTGDFLGWFHLRPPAGAPPDEPELGYRLRACAWGRGYASEGARALVDLAFSELGARRVSAETMTVHVASRRVMEKAGLQWVRTFWQEWPDAIDGDEHGDVEYALLRDDWLEQRNSLPPPE